MIATASFLAAMTVAAYAGPVRVPFVCTPGLEQGASAGVRALGLSWPDRVELAPEVCGGDLLLFADESDRAKIAGLNQRAYLVAMMGRAVLVTLHETEHQLGYANEADAESRALALTPQVLAHYLTGDDLQQAIDAAHLYDDLLPADYHHTQ
jgi:hypothetical protein